MNDSVLLIGAERVSGKEKLHNLNYSVLLIGAERVSIAHNGLKGHTTLLFYYCKNNLKIVLTLRLKVSSLKMYYNILPKILIT